MLGKRIERRERDMVSTLSPRLVALLAGLYTKPASNPASSPSGLLREITSIFGLDFNR
jgi:hypothetical protein